MSFYFMNAVSYKPFRSSLAEQRRTKSTSFRSFSKALKNPCGESERETKFCALLSSSPPFLLL